MPNVKIPMVVAITMCLTTLVVIQTCQSTTGLCSFGDASSTTLPKIPNKPVGYIGKEQQTASAQKMTPPPAPLGEVAEGAPAGANTTFGYIILTSESFHKTRISTLMSTWGQHANILFIASDLEDPQVPLIVNLKEKGKAALGKKAIKMMEMTCDQVMADKLDYVVMADDDTYLVVPNLEYVFSQINPNVPGYYGYSLTHTKVPFIGGGGGIVFSKGTMKKFCEAAKNRGNVRRTNMCQWEQCNGMAGDIAISRCMSHLHVDATHVDGFHPFPVHEMVNEPKNWCTATWWIPKHLICPPVPRAISFHYLALDRWREYYYWTYRFRRELEPKKYANNGKK